MSFRYEERLVDSIYIHKIWHTVTTSSGIYTAGLDGNWDIIISRSASHTLVTVNGIGKHAATVPYVAGIDSIGIALKPGVYLADLNGHDIVDKQHVLFRGKETCVTMSGLLFAIPDYSTAEHFVDELAAAGVLLVNQITAEYSADEHENTSGRSLRRHVRNTTGLSPNYLRQIKRAQYATLLLQSGTSIAAAAAEAGYADQAHMTKAVKQLMGRTPAQIASSATSR